MKKHVLDPFQSVNLGKSLLNRRNSSAIRLKFWASAGIVGGMPPRKKSEVKENKESPPTSGKGRGGSRPSAAKSKASKSIAPLLDAENAAAVASSGQLSGFARGLLE